MDQRSKTTSHKKMVFEYSATRRTSFVFGSRLTSECDSETREREDLCGIDSCTAAVSSKHVERQERRDLRSSGIPEEQLLTKPTKNPKPNKIENHDIELGDPLCSDIPEWLKEFRENLVDDRVPEHRDTHASSSHESSLEPTLARSVDLGKHSVETHFPKFRNCEICKRTKITRAPCRSRIGRVVPRAENFGDLITADNKIVSAGCEISKRSSMCSRGAGLGYPMDQSYPCKNKNFSGKTKGACKSSWSPKGILKSFTLTIPWNLAKLVKISRGIIVRRHHTDQKHMGLLKEQCAE